ncbi:galactokinase [Facklamia languida]|uniref:Galactokinase n=1 Tax=Facklamia languida CCUG 37842 TaxID=883113 RepID=H3NHE5_9LACT|nr:galactokinase [Facklamia languida]EHR38200.1 galactokinase [Facklamia languida CCUG 37842]
MNINDLKEKFESVFKEKPDRVFFSPGRVNLIGEHIDYNGGHVFPCAISLGTYGLVSMRADDQVACYSLNFEADGVRTFSTKAIRYQADQTWLNYISGTVHLMQEQAGRAVRGFNLLIQGDIPNGAGLSSSASLELLVAYIANQTSQLGLSRLDLVKVGQAVENQFIGVNTGIMDQFAVAMGQENEALFLDVNTLEFDRVPADFGEYALLIMNTNKRRELADSKYNQRRAECEEALARLQKILEIKHLGDLDVETFEANRHLIADPILEARAKHAVYENQRTLQARAALMDHDIEQFANLLNQSHQSLKEDYQVTGIELDTLVQAAWDHEAVLGARMTGAGMGGCAIALVQKEYLDQVQTEIAQAYQQKIGYTPSFYLAEVGSGTCER